MMVTKDDGLTAYLKQVLNQLSKWLLTGNLQKVVLVLTGVDSKEILERYALFPTVAYIMRLKL